jgi:voltage-gated potassium channel Kch
VPVVAVERNGASRNVRLARALRIPVVVGDAGDRFVLDRLVLRKARALAAVASDDLENVAVAVTTRAVSAATRVVMRAGDHGAIAETRSLFAIGQVCDVNALSAAYFTLSLRGCPPAYVFGQDHDVVAVADDGSCRSVAEGYDGEALTGTNARRVPHPRDGSASRGSAELVPREPISWKGGS